MKTWYYIVMLVLISSCSSSKIVNEWKSPDAVNFEANKVLIIGMTQDTELRRHFESQLTTQLERKGVIAVRSVDFFEASFMEEKKTEDDLNEIENQLLDAGFDAILFSKVISSEDKVTLMQAIRDFDQSFDSFREDYYGAQDVFSRNNEYESYKLHHAETNLYCICPDKERELLWKGNIDVVESENRNKSIRNYVRVLIKQLDENQLLIVDL
ncbi:MAG: hypothetical protein K0U54_04490 [Bacteroidetes bacterium]|nr:hypothetical protein [Bacteroidota bacterium]